MESKIDSFHFGDNDCHNNDIDRREKPEVYRKIRHIKFFKQALAIAKVFKYLQTEASNEDKTFIQSLNTLYNRNGTVQALTSTRVITGTDDKSNYFKWLNVQETNDPDRNKYPQLKDEISNFFAEINQRPTHKLYGEEHDRLTFLINHHHEFCSSSIIFDYKGYTISLLVTDRILYKDDDTPLYIFRHDSVFVKYTVENDPMKSPETILVKTVFFKYPCPSFKTIEILQSNTAPNVHYVKINDNFFDATPFFANLTFDIADPQPSPGDTSSVDYDFGVNDVNTDLLSANPQPITEILESFSDSYPYADLIILSLDLSRYIKITQHDVNIIRETILNDQIKATMKEHICLYRLMISILATVFESYNMSIFFWTFMTDLLLTSFKSNLFRFFHFDVNIQHLDTAKIQAKTVYAQNRELAKFMDLTFNIPIAWQRVTHLNLIGRISFLKSFLREENMTVKCGEILKYPYTNYDFSESSLRHKDIHYIWINIYQFYLGLNGGDIPIITMHYEEMLEYLKEFYKSYIDKELQYETSHDRKVSLFTHVEIQLYTSFDEMFYQNLESTMGMFFRNLNPILLKLLLHHVNFSLAPRKQPAPLTPDQPANIEIYYKEFTKLPGNLESTYRFNKVRLYRLMELWNKKSKLFKYNEKGITDLNSIFDPKDMRLALRTRPINVFTDTTVMFNGETCAQIAKNINNYFDDQSKRLKKHRKSTVFLKNVYEKLLKFKKDTTTILSKHPDNYAKDYAEIIKTKEGKEWLQHYVFAELWNKDARKCHLSIIHKSKVIHSHERSLKLSTEHLEKLYWLNLYEKGTDRPSELNLAGNISFLDHVTTTFGIRTNKTFPLFLKTMIFKAFQICTPADLLNRIKNYELVFNSYYDHLYNDTYMNNNIHPVKFNPTTFVYTTHRYKMKNNWDFSVKFDITNIKSLLKYSKDDVPKYYEEYVNAQWRQSTFMPVTIVDTSANPTFWNYKRSVWGIFFNNYSFPYIGILHKCNDDETNKIDFEPIYTEKDPFFFYKYDVVDAIDQFLKDFNYKNNRHRGFFDFRIIDHYVFQFFKMVIKKNITVAIVVEVIEHDTTVHCLILWLPTTPTECGSLTTDCQLFSGFLKNIWTDFNITRSGSSEYDQAAQVYFISLEIPFYLSYIILEPTCFHFALECIELIIMKLNDTYMKQVIEMKLRHLRTFHMPSKDPDKMFFELKQKVDNLECTKDDIDKILNNGNFDTKLLTAAFSLFFYCTVLIRSMFYGHPEVYHFSKTRNFSIDDITKRLFVCKNAEINDYIKKRFIVGDYIGLIFNKLTELHRYKGDNIITGTIESYNDMMYITDYLTDSTKAMLNGKIDEGTFIHQHFKPTGTFESQKQRQYSDIEFKRDVVLNCSDYKKELIGRHHKIIKSATLSFKTERLSRYETTDESIVPFSDFTYLVPRTIFDFNLDNITDYYTTTLSAPVLSSSSSLTDSSLIILRKATEVIIDSNTESVFQGKYSLEELKPLESRTIIEPDTSYPKETLSMIFQHTEPEKKCIYVLIYIRPDKEQYSIYISYNKDIHLVCYSNEYDWCYAFDTSIPLHINLKYSDQKGKAFNIESSTRQKTSPYFPYKLCKEPDGTVGTASDTTAAADGKVLTTGPNQSPTSHLTISWFRSVNQYTLTTTTSTSKSTTNYDTVKFLDPPFTLPKINRMSKTIIVDPSGYGSFTMNGDYNYELVKKCVKSLVGKKLLTNYPDITQYCKMAEIKKEHFMSLVLNRMNFQLNANIKNISDEFIDTFNNVRFPRIRVILYVEDDFSTNNVKFRKIAKSYPGVELDNTDTFFLFLKRSYDGCKLYHIKYDTSSSGPSILESIKIPKSLKSGTTSILTSASSVIGKARSLLGMSGGGGGGGSGGSGGGNSFFKKQQSIESIHEYLDNNSYVHISFNNLIQLTKVLELVMNSMDESTLLEVVKDDGNNAEANNDADADADAEDFYILRPYTKLNSKNKYYILSSIISEIEKFVEANEKTLYDDCEECLKKIHDIIQTLEEHNCKFAAKYVKKTSKHFEHLIHSIMTPTLERSRFIEKIKVIVDHLHVFEKEIVTYMNHLDAILINLDILEEIENLYYAITKGFPLLSKAKLIDMTDKHRSAIHSAERFFEKKYKESFENKNAMIKLPELFQSSKIHAIMIGAKNLLENFDTKKKKSLRHLLESLKLENVWLSVFLSYYLNNGQS